MNIFDFAKNYLGKGFSIIPVGKDKRPLIPWAEYQNRRPTEEEVSQWFNNGQANIGIVTGKISGIVVVDFDSEQAIEFAKANNFPTTPMVKTSRGYHAYYRYRDGVRNFQKRDDLPGIDLRGDGGFAVAPPSIHETGTRYEWLKGRGLDDLPFAELPEIILIKTPQDKIPLKELYQGVTQGSRNDTLARLVGSWANDGLSFEECLENAYLWNEKNNPPLPLREVMVTVGSILKTHQRKEVKDLTERIPEAETTTWPELNNDMFYGLAGDMVRAIEPYSEADPVALLVQFIAGFGNIIGRTAYFEVEADKHFANIFSVLVGETSKARKGTSWGHIQRFFVGISPEWADRIQSGLSSGEGLIWSVRDPITRTEAIREDREIRGYRDVVIDKGIDDKRLLTLEPEFSATLRVLGREGNTLSAVIRQAWENGNLRAMTKNSPARASNAHISIIGHITKEELIRYLTSTEAGNGFANRFLWLCVKRSKCLPRGGRMQGVDFGPISKRLKGAVEFARNTGRVEPNEESWQVWEKVYPSLSEGEPGLLGAVTSRAEAQVMRLSMIYALFDISSTIKPEHLIAGLALWDYCYESAKYIFGDVLGDPIADEILSALRRNPEGVTRTEIRDLFGRHKGKESIDRALNLLAKRGLVYMEKSNTNGRPVERWGATKETKAT